MKALQFVCSVRVVRVQRSYSSRAASVQKSGCLGWTHQDRSRVEETRLIGTLVASRTSTDRDSTGIVAEGGKGSSKKKNSQKSSSKRSPRPDEVCNFYKEGKGSEEVMDSLEEKAHAQIIMGLGDDVLVEVAMVNSNHGDFALIVEEGSRRGDEWLLDPRVEQSEIVEEKVEPISTRKSRWADDPEVQDDYPQIELVQFISVGEVHGRMNSPSTKNC